MLIKTSSSYRVQGVQYLSSNQELINENHQPQTAVEGYRLQYTRASGNDVYNLSVVMNNHVYLFNTLVCHRPSW